MVTRRGDLDDEEAGTGLASVHQHRCESQPIIQDGLDAPVDVQVTVAGWRPTLCERLNSPSSECCLVFLGKEA